MNRTNEGSICRDLERKWTFRHRCSSSMFTLFSVKLKLDKILLALDTILGTLLAPSNVRENRLSGPLPAGIGNCTSFQIL